MRWVLGEQSAKQLRGARMDEVIFAGNNLRRPLGMAEVTLTFDNSDSTLATPFTEIAVTRRVYRTGEGEYFINRAQVRLRDIMDLLLGTGLGPDASAIVSQGEIDAVLSAKPEERREIFEEAAGTSKYQARKRESQRRLEQTEQNALRVNDVLAEIELQVPALESQVRRAKRYRKATERLRELEILSFVRKTAARREERSGLAAALGDEERVRAEEDAARDRLASDVNTSRYEEYQATVALDERGTARDQVAARVQDAATAFAAAQARSEETDRRCVDLTAVAESAARDVEEARSRIETLTRELAQSRSRRDTALGTAERAAAAERAGAQEWEASYAALRLVEDRRAVAAADAAESDTAAHGALAEHQRLVEQERRMSQEWASVARSVDEERVNGSRLSAELAELEATLARRTEDAGVALARRDQASRSVEGARASLETAREKSVEIKARLDALNEFEDAGIGVPAGVKAVRAAREEKALAGIVGCVADLIDVDAAHAAAIDVALGIRIHDIVTERADHARAAIALLKTRRAGRATFLPLDLVRQQSLQLAPDVRGAQGYVGRAVDLVRSKANVRGVVEHLLADVVVVNSLEAALALAATHPDATIVTTEGEVVKHAALTGGSGDGDTGPLARRAQISDLKRELEHVAMAATAAENAYEAARARSLKAAGDVDSAAERSVEAQLAKRDAQGALARVRSQIEALERRNEELRELAAQAARELEKSQRDSAHYAARAQAARKAADALEAERGEAARRADRLQEALTALRDTHRQAAAEAAALVERVAQAGDDVEAARAAHVASVAAHEDKIAVLEEARAERDRGRAAVAGLAVAKAQAETQFAEVEAQVAAQRARRDELAARTAELEAAQAAEQNRDRERSMELERHRIRLAEIDAELSVLQETFAQNPATASECDAVAARYATFEGEADAEIRRLRDEVARLGNVNLNALEDQAALLERREFLGKQLADLEQARASILSVIAEIDAESVRQFNATFEKIAQAFSETFARLFTGGVGKIWLAESDDPTQAGIEIAAAPPGKKMQSLNLLSGGERAMTAVALIFSILQVRPSPFYIFDEIDAALDEANIGRFGSLLREVASRAQTVIITHNKATMTLADRIYGVTVGEPGLSSVLSLALEQVSA